MEKKRIWYRKSMSTNSPGSPHTISFVAFSCTMGNWLGNPYISHMMKYTVRWKSYGENSPILWESVSTNFPGPPHTKGFVAFSRTMRNWWGNPWISHMLKYTIEWELDGKKAPMLWEKYDYQFPRLSPYRGFCCIFLYCGKFIGKPIHFPYAEVYHRMGIGWETSTHAMGKVWVSVSQTSPIPWVLLHFPVLWEIYGETHAFLICWSIP